jgi:hypothetical protein
VEVRMERLALELGERARCVLQSLTLNLWRQGCESCSVFDITPGSPLCRGLTRATYILCIERRRKRRLLAGNRTRDLLHCRRTLYAKSHSNGVIDCHSEPLLVLLQLHI